MAARLFVFAVAAIPATALGQAPGIINLGGLNGNAGSAALGVSGDGRVVVGHVADGLTFNLLPFRWSETTGMVSLGQLNGGPIAAANAVNRDGSVIVGDAVDGSISTGRAFRWTQATGMVSLGVLNGGSASAAYAVNSDGTVVAGEASDGAALGLFRAFRWTQAAGMTSLGVLSGGSSSTARGISGDGTVVVGTSFGNATQAFRWTQGTGMVGLGFLNGGNSSAAYAVNSDGTVVVGDASDGAVSPPFGNRAFRWTQATGMVSLGVLNGGSQSQARAVNRDGTVVVGTASDGNGIVHAFRWSESRGMQIVEDWLRDHGISVPANITAVGSGVSDDGSVVVGTLVSGNHFAFVARVSAAGSGLITMTDLQASLSGNASTGPQAANLGGMVMHGAHSRPLERRVEPGKSCFWAGGDVGRDDHGEGDGSFALGEIGGCHRLSQNVQGSLSLGTTWSRQDLVFDGRSEVRGTYAVAEVLGRFPGTNLWPSAALLYQQGDADVRRGYLNAGVQGYSSGRPDVQTTALRLRLDWEDAARLGSLSITPHADVSYARTGIEAYTETGGGFPASFGERTEESTELRLGADAAYPLSSATKLHGRLEAAHRFEKTGASTSGTVLGLFSFELPGQQSKRDWLRAGLGITAKIGSGIASAMANATTEGAAPSYWLNLSYQVAF